MNVEKETRKVETIRFQESKSFFGWNDNEWNHDGSFILYCYSSFLFTIIEIIFNVIGKYFARILKEFYKIFNLKRAKDVGERYLLY